MNYNSGDILSGKYRIIDILGGGAMGTVYRAEHLKMQKTVAIKVLHGDFADKDEYKKRFRREAQAAASLEHSNICTVMDYDTTEQGDSYIVMELLAGETLKKRLERMGRLSALASVRIARQLMGALSSAHQVGIVHRDVKPDNVFLIQREGCDDFVKLIDFGIAHIENSGGDLKTLTQAGQIYGTPQYISPEQAQGDPVDHRADLYAAGVILYEMLVGHPPFDGKNYIDLLIKQVNDPAPHLPSDIPQYQLLDGLVQGLLQKDPNDRYQSAMDIIPKLDEALLLLSADGAQNGDLSSILSSHSLSISMQALNAQSQAPSQPSGQVVISDNIQAQESKSSFANHRNWQLSLLIVLLLIFIIILGKLVLDNMDNKKKHAPEVADVAQVAEPPAAVPDVPDEPEEIGEPQPYNYDVDEYKISYDKVLSHEDAILKSMEFYNDKDYDDAMKSLDSVREKYWDHPNFLRLYAMTAKARKYNEEIMESIAHLFAIEENGSRNPAISKLANDFFSRDNYVDFKNAIIKEGTTVSATSMAWLIIQTGYDKFEVRRSHMIETYDALDNKDVPEWLKESVEIWRLDKSNCRDRRTKLTRLAQQDEFSNEIFNYILKPMNESRDAECKVKSGKRFVKKDCNACLKDWLADAVNSYELRAAKQAVLESDEFNEDNPELGDKPEKEEAAP